MSNEHRTSGKIEIVHNSSPCRQSDGRVGARAVVYIGDTRAAQGYGPTVTAAILDAVKWFRLKREDRWQKPLK